jgi:hypothetical protein
LCLILESNDGFLQCPRQDFGGKANVIGYTLAKTTLGQRNRRIFLPERHKLDGSVLGDLAIARSTIAGLPLSFWPPPCVTNCPLR